MAPRRRVNPELIRAFESAQAEPIEPLDFSQPGRLITVDYPADPAQEPPAPVAPRSRFDVVRDYLEQSRQPMPMPTTPEVDVRGAADFDARRNFGQSMLAAGQAFTGNRRAMPQVTNAAETQAMGERDARKRELEQWAAGRETQRTREAGLLGQAMTADESARQREAAYGQRQTTAEAQAEQRKLEQAERERHNRVVEEDADLNRDAKKKPPKKPEAPDEVRFEDMTFSYVGPKDGPKDVRVAGAKKIRETAAAWATATSAMNDLEGAMREFQKNPTISNRSMLFAPALTAAGAVNAAIGQGAMSDAEKQAQFQMLGINLADPASVQGLLEKDPEGFVRRVLGAKKIARGALTAQARVYGYDPKGAKADDPAPTKTVTVREKKTGRTKSLPEAAARALPPAEFEVLP